MARSTLLLDGLHGNKNIPCQFRSLHHSSQSPHQYKSPNLSIKYPGTLNTLIFSNLFLHKLLLTKQYQQNIYWWYCTFSTKDGYEQT